MTLNNATSSGNKKIKNAIKGNEMLINRIIDKIFCPRKPIIEILETNIKLPPQYNVIDCKLIIPKYIIVIEAMNRYGVTFSDKYEIGCNDFFVIKQKRGIFKIKGYKLYIGETEKNIRFANVTLSNFTRNKNKTYRVLNFYPYLKHYIDFVKDKIQVQIIKD